MNFLRPLHARLALCALGLALLPGCHPAAPRATDPAPKVEGDTVIYTPDAPQRTALVAIAVQSSAGSAPRFTGRLVWDEEATVRIYSPVLGRVRAIDAQLGDTLAAGAPLARIDSPDLGQALADARKAEADFTLAQRALARARDLFTHGALAQKDVDSAEDTAAGAAAERERARTKLALYNATPESGPGDGLFVLRTPLTGIVVEKNINPGQEVRPDTMMSNVAQLTAAPFVVTDPQRLWVLLDASELDVAALRPHQLLRITSPAYPGRAFTGEITAIGAALDATTRTLKVRGRVENPGALLKAEMYVDAEAERGAAPGAVTVAAQAVFLSNNQAYVYVETTPGRYTRRAVRTGAEAASQILIQMGLNSGERVIVEGALLLEAVRTGGGAS